MIWYTSIAAGPDLNANVRPAGRRWGRTVATGKAAMLDCSAAPVEQIPVAFPAW
jgi:hypothetical protein